MTDAATATGRVTAALDNAEDDAAFACRTILPSGSLTLSIKEKGEIRLPVSATRAKQLAALASPAPFGRGQDTLLDPLVRDVGEIPARKLALDRRAWNRALIPALDEMREALGLPAGRLTARVDKLLVYGPGQFFKPHRDTERNDDMIGTLVVVLPSPHKGGTLVVSHSGETQRFITRTTLEPRLCLYAFYATCEHEIRPVTTGHRIVLSHTLHFRAAASTAEPESNVELQHALSDYFDPADRATGRFGKSLDKLVYLLDHAYSPRSLGWHRMKGVDRSRAQALLAAATDLDLQAHLALVSVTETWSAMVDEPRYYRSGRGYWDDDDWDDDGDDDIGEENAGNVLLAETHYELEELIERGASLDKWRDRNDRAVALPNLSADEDELCWTANLETHTPEIEEYEGYMGNYGNTLQREYRRAAVVLWPAIDRYRILARSGSGGQVVLRELVGDADRLGAATVDSAIDSLLEVWPGQSREKDPDTLRDALALAELLQSTDRITELLHGLSISSLTKREIPTLLELGERHGEAFCLELFDRWLGSDDSSDDRHALFQKRKDLLVGRWFSLESDRDRLDWLTQFPDFCRAVMRSAETAWQRVAASSFDILLELTVARHVTQHRLASPNARARCADRERLDLLALLEASDVLDDEIFPKRLLVAIDAELDNYASIVMIDVLERVHALPTVGRQKTRRVALTRRMKAVVQKRIRDAARAADDWRIDASPKCSCADCLTLTSFLQSKDAAIDLPLAKARRQHLHQAISVLDIPVSHTTRREGRPFVLELRKKKSLFKDAAKRVADEQAVATRLIALPIGP